MSDDWRIRIEPREAAHAETLLGRLGFDLGSDEAKRLARELEGHRLAVSRDDDTIFVYAESQPQAEQARQIVEAELREEGIEAEVEIEPDVVVQPFTVLRGRTIVRSGAEVGPHAVALDAEIGPGAAVGPFTYLRPGTVLAAGVKVGAFVEVKDSRIGERTKVPHLSYIGDADIGEDSNIAAGAITANYRPETGAGAKQRTVIGRNVHTGSDNVFVAPVEIGDDAWIGAGSTITEDVPPGALAVARARQVNREGFGGKRND
jgi:bifunctional UDP-N-acetylglucosamine pyrophosphorylase/glucosamine-1-phosphate N-acetyltransferase